MTKFNCEYCGTEATSIATLIASSCHLHPNGSNKGKHKLYEGSKKTKYNCKYCGTSASSIRNLVINSCHRHPNGSNKGKHEVAL